MRRITWESPSRIFPPGRELVAATDIPLSHKVALADLAQGEPLIKYGEIIGRAAVPIRAGEWVHTHNMQAEERTS